MDSFSRLGSFLALIIPNLTSEDEEGLPGKLFVFGLVESAMGRMALHSIGYAFEMVTIVDKKRTENYEKRVLDKITNLLNVGGSCNMNQLMTIERVDRTEHVKRKNALPNRDKLIDDTRWDEVAVAAQHR